MKRHLVVDAGGSTSAYVTAAASSFGIIPPLRHDGTTMPQYVLCTVERGKEVFMQVYDSFFNPPADADLELLTDKHTKLELSGRQALVRFKEKTVGATFYVTPLSNH